MKCVFVCDARLHRGIACTDSFCESCNPHNLTQCYACLSGVENLYYDPASYSCKCLAGTYRDEDGGACKVCNYLCKECDGPGNSRCLAGKCAAQAYPMLTLQTTCIYMCRTSEDNMFLDPDLGACKCTLFSLHFL